MSKNQEQAEEDLRRCFFAFHRMMLLSLLSFACLFQWLPPYGELATYRLSMKHLWPQTWSFYTDVVGGTQMTAYRWPAQPGRSPEPLAVRQASWRSLNGFRRTTHAQIAEVARVSLEVPDDRWHFCRDGRLTACTEGPSEPVLSLINRAPWPTLCGSVILAIERRVVLHEEAGTRTEQVAFVELRCSGR